jgi:hypothetical protein
VPGFFVPYKTIKLGNFLLPGFIVKAIFLAAQMALQMPV